MKIINMKGNNTSLRMWFDIITKNYVYVLRWRRGNWPYLYRSSDGTPTRSKCYFGFRSMMND